ncbi:MAG: pyruvate formate lyase family protein [Bacteroidales bacterium]|nr:pyruvate formate lyase family protein [Bacteroidales bacterium]
MKKLIKEETIIGSTPRINSLIKSMEKRAWADRSSEWFTKDMFADIGNMHTDQSVIVRRALAIEEILKAMTNKELFDGNNPHYKIRKGELIVGVITLGSLGLGKSFPNYITDQEKDVASVTTKSEMGLFGHDSVNYEVMLQRGLNGIINDCKKELGDIEHKINHYNNLFDYCDKIENEKSFTAEIFKLKSKGKATETVESLKEIFEDDKNKGNRTIAYEKELDGLFDLLENHIVTNNNEITKKKNNKQDAEAIPYLKHIKEILSDKRNILHNRRDFYKSVSISCNAVISYAGEFSKLAEEMIQKESNPIRLAELKEIKRICEKVPANPAKTFHEALQSIYFFHLALHSSMNQLSLGRLDQVLQPFYKKEDEEKQQELFECFLIKCAERLILDSNTFVKQDHLDYGSNLLTIPVPLDQWAESNEFLQNIIIGGQTRDGYDAVNDCTYLILKAFQKTKLYTPTLNARIYKKQLGEGSKSAKYLNAVAECLYETKNGMPVIGNDEVLIPAMNKYSDIPIEEARDYVIDGCWEPLLNGSCDWTFRMFNMLTALECALNGGATLSSNPILLRGQKLSYETPLPASEDTNIDFGGLKDILKKHIKFFTDNAALSIHKLYVIDQAINPNPLYSALLKGCMENGRDKTWGGAKYKLAGIIPAAVPNTVNTLAAIQKWVYDKKEFKLSDVLDAFRYGYTSDDRNKQAIFKKIKCKFQTDSPKFGNNDKKAEEIMQWLLNAFYDCVRKSHALAEEVFLYPVKKGDEERIMSLRALAGYSGKSLKEEFGKDFRIHITAGMGTFELFDIFGGGNAASADRNKVGDPIARNFAPMVGTTNYSLGHLLSSFKNLGLNRFAGGVITDLCLEESDLGKNGADIVKAVIQNFMHNDGNMMTITISDKKLLSHIYDLCEKNRNGDPEAKVELKQYERVNVRVGGFQMPFITLPPKMQLSYIDRPISPSN